MCRLPHRLGHQLRPDLQLRRHRRTIVPCFLGRCRHFVSLFRAKPKTQGHRRLILLSMRFFDGSLAIYLMFDPLFIPIFFTNCSLRDRGDFVVQFHHSIFATFGGGSLIPTTTSAKLHMYRCGSEDWASFACNLVDLLSAVGQVWVVGCESQVGTGYESIGTGNLYFYLPAARSCARYPT